MDELKPESAPSQSRDAVGAELPRGVRIAAAWSWRLILIGALLAGVLWLIVQVRIIVIPLFVAILLTALLSPLVNFFQRRGAPKWLGVITALAVFIVAVWLLISLIVTQVRSGFDDVAKRAEEVMHNAFKWAEATFGISADQFGGYVDQIMSTLEAHQSSLWNGALGVATSAGQFVAGTLLTVFSLIFLLLDGNRIWNWVLGFLPARAHAPVDAAGRSGWISVGHYVRIQIFVAFVDAVGIGGGAAILGVPLAIPIAVLVFLGAFIPFLGAIATGLLAAFVALVYNGPVNALIMLGIVILVNQIEGHVLQPLVMGNAVRVHPLGVVLAVSTGTLIAGIPGALFAVPITAALNSIVNTLVRKEWAAGTDPVAEYHRKDKLEHEARHRARIVARLRRKEGHS